jgi:hypothetical protein
VHCRRYETSDCVKLRGTGVVPVVNAVIVACVLLCCGCAATEPQKAPEPVRIEGRTKAGTTFQLTGRDAIQYCVMVNNAEGLRRLLSEGHDIMRPCGDGSWTFLHVAVQQGSRDCAELLLEHKADANATIEGGRTALQIAEDAGDKQMSELLRKYGAH